MSLMITITRNTGEKFFMLKVLKARRRYAHEYAFGYGWHKFEDVKSVAVLNLKTFIEIGGC